MSHAEHLTAVYAAQLKLGGVGASVRQAINLDTQFDGLLIAAVGVQPGTDPGSQAAAASIELREALFDAARLADRIDDLLTEYRRAI